MLNTVTKLLILSILFATAGCTETMSAAQANKELSYKNKENIERSVRSLDTASRWMIENAISVVLTNPDDYFSKISAAIELTLGVTPYSDPALESEDELPRYIIVLNTIYYDINLLQRAQQNNLTYEYWAISTSSRELKPPLYTSARQFLISKTKDIKGTREIIKESDQFFHEFSVDNKVVLSIDAENDMEIRQTLGAWIAPQHYKNYPQLTHDEVILDAEGNYHLKSESKHPGYK